MEVSWGGLPVEPGEGCDLRVSSGGLAGDGETERFEKRTDA
jgi:hypothetical protein